MTRVINFSAGPATLPEEVLRRASEELLEYRDSGMSVMEMSHRSPAYQEIIDSAESLIRELLSIPDNYHVLFLQGGASLQFAMIPLNLMGKTGKCNFIHTGVWTAKAIAEARRFGNVTIIASSEDKNFTYIPEISKKQIEKDAAYLHICTNNTIYGTRYSSIPGTIDIPLVADMSSSILSEAIDVSQYGLIFAGAQKNIGPAGVTIVIIRDDLVGHAMKETPTMLDYATHTANGSMFNTPPTYGIYIARLVFEHLKKNGGIKAMEKTNLEKASLLYDYLDASNLFSGRVDKNFRSLMNITFTTGSDEIDNNFITAATGEGLVNLKGHRTIGGMRASLYNAMPVSGVKQLVDFMAEFESKNA